jgi:hypothetical protein
MNNLCRRATTQSLGNHVCEEPRCAPFAELQGCAPPLGTDSRKTIYIVVGILCGKMTTITMAMHEWCLNHRCRGHRPGKDPRTHHHCGLFSLLAVCLVRYKLYRGHVEIIRYLDDMAHESPALLMLARKVIGGAVRTIVSELLATVTRAVRRTQMHNLKAP